jgi:hypothetical protein
MIWLSNRRKLKAARLRLSAVAESVGAKEGTVLMEEFTGGIGFLSSPLSLAIVTLRSGQDDEVAQAQIDAARAAGYTQPPGLAVKKGRRCLFPSQDGLPQLSIETVSSGERISSFGVVPTGQTGVVVSLS